jgi:hypothetical protein
VITIAVRHRALPLLAGVARFSKALCERCGERPPTHEVKCDDPRAKWAGAYVVAVGAFHREVCEPCLREVLGGR